MGFDGLKLVGGAVLYATLVMLPTVGLYMDSKSWDNAFAERATVGVLGVLAGRMAFAGLRGPDAATHRASPDRQTFLGFRPVVFGAGAAVLYLAWLSSLPQAIAGQVGGDLIVTRGNQVVPLAGAWQRVITSAITAIGVWLVAASFHTTKTPEERRAARSDRKARRRERKASHEAAVWDGQSQDSFDT